MGKKGVLINMDETFIVGVRFGGSTVYMEVGISEFGYGRGMDPSDQVQWQMSVRVVQGGIEKAPEGTEFIGDEPKKLKS